MIELLTNIGFSVLLTLLAFTYSSIGHGGASGYLALMALFSFAPSEMRPIALVLNLFVSAISFIQFKRIGHFKWHLFYPFALTSIPASFLGGLLKINPTLFKQTLGVLILFAVYRLLGYGTKSNTETKKNNIAFSLILGALIGLFSGMIGIGGGIILTPVILLLGWGNVKETAAVSALFIFVNSLAGIIGFSINSGIIPSQVLLYIPLALLGGFFGGLWGSQKFNHIQLKYLLAIVLIMAGLKLLIL